jgi:undecaprenyl-diphosphatase
MTTFGVNVEPAPAQPQTADRSEPRHAVLTMAGVGALGVLALSTLLVVAGLLVTGVLETADREGTVNRYLANHRTSVGDDVSFVASGLAHGFVIVPLAVAAATWLVWRRRWALLGLLAVGLLVEVTTYLIVAAVVGRDRPPVHRLEALPTDSFPSGHVAASVVLYTLLAVILAASSASVTVQRLAIGAAVTIPVLVSLARIYRGVHYVSDVIAGLLLGLGALVVAFVAARRAQAIHPPAVDP